MNTQLVDSFAKRLGTKIVQMVESLPAAERELFKQKLFSIVPYQEQVEGSIGQSQNCSNELTLKERRAFLRQPLAERRSILVRQSEELLTHYQSSTEWRELMAGDIIDD
jgi:hypothetical protein